MLETYEWDSHSDRDKLPLKHTQRMHYSQLEWNPNPYFCGNCHPYRCQYDTDRGHKQ